MVDVDHLAVKPLRRAIGQHLHVTRKHDEVRRGLAHEPQKLFLLFRLVAERDRPVVEGDPVEVRDGPRNFVVRHDRRDPCP